VTERTVRRQRDRQRVGLVRVAAADLEPVLQPWVPAEQHPPVPTCMMMANPLVCSGVSPRATDPAATPRRRATSRASFDEHLLHRHTRWLTSPICIPAPQYGGADPWQAAESQRSGALSG
jgi:hypothetical protein